MTAFIIKKSAAFAVIEHRRLKAFTTLRGQSFFAQFVCTLLTLCTRSRVEILFG